MIHQNLVNVKITAWEMHTCISMYPDELVGLLPQVMRYVQEAVVLGEADHGLVRLLGYSQHDRGRGGSGRRRDGAKVLRGQRRCRRAIAARPR